MNLIQNSTVLIVGIASSIGFAKAIVESVFRKNPFGYVWHIYNFTGAYVWADQVVFGIFWSIACLISLILNDWIFFLLIFSVFWVVRSFGETVYWLNQQFSPRNLNPTERFWLHKLFPGESVWFVYQIMQQCILVISIISSIYFSKLWLLQ